MSPRLKGLIGLIVTSLLLWWVLRDVSPAEVWAELREANLWLMAGAVVVENVFAINGLGRVLIQGILNRDYPVVQGAILVVAAIFVFTNLLVDILYTVIDPRIKYES